MTGRTTEALWYAAAGRAEIRSEPLLEPGPGEVQVRALHSGISRGTERLVLTGRVPPSEFGRMRAPFMVGAFPFPVKYGYSAVGLVERGPAALEGRVVFTFYPHQSVFNVPAAAVAPVPNPVPAARAVLGANMETALNAVWDAQPAPADHIAVVGAGVVGALVAWLCAQLPNAQVTLVDVEPSRSELARRLGRARGRARRLRPCFSCERNGSRSCDRGQSRRHGGDGVGAELVRHRRCRGAARRRIP